MMKAMYLMATTMTNDHTIIESTPYTLSGMAARPYSLLNACRMA